MMEAAACGLVLIAPAYSAYLHHPNVNDRTSIPATLAPATVAGHMGAEDAIFFDGLSWRHPDEDAAVEIIRRIVREDWKPDASPQQRIVAEYTWENAARALQAILAS